MMSEHLIICKGCERRYKGCEFAIGMLGAANTLMCKLTEENCSREFSECPIQKCSLDEFCARAYKLGKNEGFSTGMKRGFLNARMPHRSDSENIMLLSKDYSETMKSITEELLGPGFKKGEQHLTMIPIFYSTESITPYDAEVMMNDISTIVHSYPEFDNNAITEIKHTVSGYIQARVKFLQNSPVMEIGLMDGDRNGIKIRWNPFFFNVLEANGVVVMNYFERVEIE